MTYPVHFIPYFNEYGWDDNHRAISSGAVLVNVTPDPDIVTCEGCRNYLSSKQGQKAIEERRREVAEAAARVLTEENRVAGLGVN